ncbi:hypothetical protein BJY52DRAFT_1260562 [Lactarius psammicola]|nr:hypothetical protein BJY52DRAFT_1260562 [Lactarius psammicola]
MVAHDRSIFTFPNFSPRKSLLIEIFFVMCACWTRPRPMGGKSHGMVFPYGSSPCDFGYLPLVDDQRSLGDVRVADSLALWALRTRSVWIVRMTCFSRSSGKGPMLLKAIEALELPKSTFSYTLAYAAPKLVPKKGMTCLEMSTHHLASRSVLLLESTRLLVSDDFYPYLRKLFGGCRL